MIFRPRVVMTLLAALFILAFPASAAAVTYEVDSTADEADAGVGVGGCLTAGLKCTLRAAIEESNASTSVKDTVDFTAAFDGQLADTIALTIGELQITDEVTIDGDDGAPCTTQATVSGPCVGVSGTVGLDVLSDDVEIRGLAITGAGIGIAVLNESTGFTAADNWLGVKLDGTAGANTTGIFIDPGSDFASIGGITATDRNVFANSNNEGLDIEGASDAVVRGNYFGVAPDGTTQAANAKNIEITDSTASGGFAANGNEIGRTIEGEALTNDACDGGCNVIAGSLSTGIDLSGGGGNEAPATGPTTVHGNFVGLDATGTDVVANNTIGIWTGGADDVTVGGLEAGDANYIAGGSEGIVSESGGNGFKALGNWVGFGSDESEQTPPSGKGIFALNLSVTEDSEIEDNVIRMTGTVGIEVRFLTGRIINNVVEGGSRGIVAGFGDGGGLIASNEVDASEEFGILVESPKNDVRRNTVTNSNGAGIAVKPPPGVEATTGNAIGGGTTDNENVINGSTGPAIEIVEEAGEPGSWTEITRNRGASNGGLFIDLVTGANQGILPPVISSATQTKAEGTAEAGATVRLFRKATASAGEIESFLGQATADGSGKWSIAYGSVPAGTNLAATQTEEEVGTSELALTTAAADPSNGGGGNNGGGNGGGNGGNPEDKTAPDTKILKGPPKKTHKRIVKFKFASTEAGSTFQCKLDRKPFKPCASPKKYKKLKPGKHVFKVRAIDKAGNVDPTPAKRAFKIVP